jgi:hypothetical protein
MKTVNISQVDALLLNGNYSIELLLYYKNGVDTKRIRRALRNLSLPFWPLFGEYKDGVISFEKYSEAECYDEDAVDQEFVIPQTEKEQLDVLSHYNLPDIRKLFLLKVIQFPNGMALIPKMNHLAGDGYSYFYFLSALAALSRSSSFPSKSSLMKLFFKPHHRRTAVRDFSLKGVELVPSHQNGKFTVRFEEILREDVQSIVTKVSDTKNLRVSLNDVLSAMAAKELVRVQNEFFGECVELTIPIDVRRRVKEFGRRFFGNGLILHRMTLKKADIEKLHVMDIAVQIREFMPSVSKQSYVEYLAHLEGILSERRWEKFRPFDPRSGCLVTNISRLPLEKLDFGTGKPELVLPLTVEKNSTAIMAKKENFILRFVY